MKCNFNLGINISRPFFVLIHTVSTRKSEGVSFNDYVFDSRGFFQTETLKRGIDWLKDDDSEDGDEN